MRRFSFILSLAGVAVGIAAMVYATIIGHTEAIPGLRAMQAAGLMVTAGLALYVLTLVAGLRWSRSYIALAAFHLGFLLVLAGYQLETAFAERGDIFIQEGRTATTYVGDDGKDYRLPFALRLKDFRLSVYKETVRASSYVSELELTRSGDTRKDLRLLVNEPLTVEGCVLYQKSYGIEPNPAARIRLKASVDGASQDFAFAPGSSVSLPDGTVIAVEDFSPSLGLRNGEFFTFNPNGMLNPAFLTRVQRPTGQSASGWVVVNNPDSHTLAGVRLDFADFWGLEYTVIGFDASHWKWVVYLGALLAVLGLCLFYLPGAARRPS